MKKHKKILKELKGIRAAMRALYTDMRGVFCDRVADAQEDDGWLKVRYPDEDRLKRLVDSQVRLTSEGLKARYPEIFAEEGIM